VSEQIFAHDDQGQARRPNVFLCAAKSEAYFGPIHIARQDMRGKVDHQRRVTPQCFEVWQCVELDAVDGLVGAYMHMRASGSSCHFAGAGTVVNCESAPEAAKCMWQNLAAFCEDFSLQLPVTTMSAFSLARKVQAARWRFRQYRHLA
jgi:hypothetical protein